MNTYTKKTPLIKLGTRGSKLALAQAEEFKKHLVETIDVFREPGAVETVVIPVSYTHLTLPTSPKV